MSTQFDDINNGDIIDESHIDRYIVPVNNLESGATWYRDDTGTADAVKVNFATGNVVSSYTPGLIVHFKAAATNTGAATLTITGPSGDLAPIPLVKSGGVALAAGDITAEQVIAAIYAEDSPGVDGRFEVLGGLSSGGGGLTSPVAIADGGTGATSAANARTNLDVPSNAALTSGLAGKANTTHTHAATDIGAGTVSNAEFGYLDGVTSSIQTQLNSKLSGTVPIASGGTGATSASAARTNLDVPSNADLTSGLAGKANTTHTHAATDIGAGTVSNTEFGYLDGVTSSIQTQLNSKLSGTVPIASGGTGATSASAARTNLDVPSNADLTSGLAGKANTTHTHAATDIGAGTVSNTEFGYLDGVTSSIQTQLNGKASTAHTHDMADITTGSLGLARGGTGANLSGTGGTGQVLKQTSAGGVVSVGILTAGEMPSGIDAAKIGGGVVSNTEFGYLDGVTSPIQTQLNSKLSGTVPIASGGTGATSAAAARTNLGTNDAANITTGILPVARGGTGIGSLAANRLLGSGATANNIQAITIGTGLSLSGGVLSNSSTGVTGSGVANRLAYWSGGTSLTSSSSFTISGAQLNSGSFSATTGYYYGKTSGTAQTFMPQVRNFGAGQLMYFVNTSGGGSTFGEIVYQFSRGAHKEEIRNLDLSIDDLMRWRPVEFKWKERFGGSPDIGLIAEEVEAVFPLATTQDQPWEYTDEKTGDYAVDEDGVPKRLEGDPVVAGVKYEKAWIPMLAAVQDFYKKFKDEQAKTASLEARLAAIEGAR